MVRSSCSFGMSPAPIWSRMAGWTVASRRSLRIWRTEMANAEAIASSVQFSEARLSIARQRSTVAMGARIDILADRAHMVVVVGILDQDVDLGEADCDGDADASRAIDDRRARRPCP